MARLRYSINLTLDGCCDHRAGIPDEEMHLYWSDAVAEAGVLLYGRITYQMMEQAWRPLAQSGIKPDGMPDWMMPFARAIDTARKCVVSDTLAAVDWNSDLIRGPDLADAVNQLKRQESGLISTGGVQLPLALARMDLIDEYEFVVQPRIAGHGPTLLSGLPQHLDLKLLSRREFASGALALIYERRQ